MNLEAVDRIDPRMVLMTMVSVLLLTLLGSYLYGFKEPLAEFSKLQRTRIESLRAVEDERKGLDDREISLMEARLADLTERLYGKGAHLPPSQMVSYVIARLDEISGRHSVQLAGVTPGTAMQVMSFEELPFDVEVRGQYFDLFAWLQDVEKELRPMVVKQFSVTPVSGKDSLQMRLRVVSYRSTEARQ